MTQSPRDRLSRTAMSLAILAFFTIFTFPVVLPYMFGSISLVLAILSKGNRDTFSRRSKSAVIVAAVAMAINTALLASSALYFVKILHDPALQEQFSQQLYQMYGFTFEDLLNQLGLQGNVL